MFQFLQIYTVPGENLEANILGRDSNVEGINMYYSGYFIMIEMFALIQYFVLVLFSPE